MKVKLYRKWLQTVEEDWDYRLSLEDPPNPYTFASIKKLNRHAYEEDLLNLAVSYKRRNRFQCWEIFYNVHINHKKLGKVLKLRNMILHGHQWIITPEKEDIHERLILRKSLKEPFMARVKRFMKTLLMFLKLGNVLVFMI